MLILRTHSIHSRGIAAAVTFWRPIPKSMIRRKVPYNTHYVPSYACGFAVPFVRRIAFGSSVKTARVPQLQLVWNSPFYANAKKTAYLHRLFFKKNGNVLLSQAVPRQVSSALRSLTSVFGMETGVSSSLSSPHSSVHRTLKTE